MNHALIRLREERRILRDTWMQVHHDALMAALKPKEHHRLLAQLDRERREVTAAIALIEVHLGLTARAA